MAIVSELGTASKLMDVSRTMAKTIPAKPLDALYQINPEEWTEDFAEAMWRSLAIDTFDDSIARAIIRLETMIATLGYDNIFVAQKETFEYRNVDVENVHDHLFAVTSALTSALPFIRNDSPTLATEQLSKALVMLYNVADKWDVNIQWHIRILKFLMK